ncbi:hypothetical protein CDEST_05281 [Colletotrichum destructivum]|uniref:Uncharacterized protein n=1 Tax=Colletotrichum destructivum TaxID=34406 RepID=A0AAX4IAP3_9PEZI|nr:hypothetical protein CDEST_05281 [Colletotrichum destructivum]
MWSSALGRDSPTAVTAASFNQNRPRGLPGTHKVGGAKARETRSEATAVRSGKFVSRPPPGSCAGGPPVGGSTTEDERTCGPVSGVPNFGSSPPG